ncbi:MAG: LysR family transcriptional regulator [Proteobacteria bacterium]|nr:LysR family transcriptional regulator [Pseudomonadota bacterium]
MDWDKLRVFHAVAEAGSFTHAGEALNLSQSAVSRQVSALEDSLRVPLFHRHARGLILTEQGELLYQTVHEVFARLAMTEAILTETKERPSGPLKITTTVAFGSIWLAPRLREFIDLYPDISISIVLDDAELDLAMREADAAIRLRPPRQPDLIQRHLMSMRYHIFAAREYLETFGTPIQPEDLDNHRLIIYGEDARPPVANVNWLMDVGVRKPSKRRPVLMMNNIYGIFLAVKSGLGIGALPQYMSHDAKDLVEILPSLRGPGFDAYFVYPEELRHSKRIAVFRDFLLRKIAESQLADVEAS